MKKAIIGLTRGFYDLNSYSQLIQRNHHIERNLNNIYDNIIFHEGNILIDHQQYIQSFTNIPIKFVEIPRFLPREGIQFAENSGHPLWCYRNMCSFWFVDFWKYIEDYDMILRVDDDCMFESNIDLIFNALENKVCVCGYWDTDFEHVTQGLNKFSLDFFGDDRGPRDPSGPYTNVIGLNVNKLRSNKKLFEYIDKVKESNNILIYRWGDLPLWGEVLYYLYSSDDYCVMEDIKYYHISHHRKVNYE